MKTTTVTSAAAFLLGIGAGMGLRALSQRERFYFAGRTVVITGGSRGLGLEMARAFAREGARLALLARDEAELRRAESELTAQGASVLPITCDVGKREEVDAAIQRITEQFGGIDVLINNAGIIQVGPFEHMTVEDFEISLAVHLYGPLHTTMAVLPHMRRAGGGRIVNISSIGGKLAIPHLAPYCAGKFALVGLSDALRAELRRSNIFVTTICPGLMRTGSPPNAQFKGRHHQEYAWFAVCDSLPLLSIDARRAARRIIEACRRGQARLLVGAQTKAAVILSELFPGATASLLAAVSRLLPKPDPRHGQEIHVGWESQSAWAPSLLTRLSDHATVKNNEQPAAG